MAKVKVSASVLASNKLKTEKQQELDAAEALVKKLRDEVRVATIAARQAQIDDDANLPQCNMVSVQYRSGAETECGRMVIMRKTPAGTLIVRRVGETEYDFKFVIKNGKYVQKDTILYSSTNELRNVPADFLP